MATKEEDFVGGVLKAHARRGDVVHDEQVDVFIAQLLQRVRQNVGRFGGEAHDDLTIRSLRHEIGQDVGRALQMQLGYSITLLQLFARRSGRKVRHRRGHDHALTFESSFHHRLVHLRGALDGHHLDGAHRVEVERSFDRRDQGHGRTHSTRRVRQGVTLSPGRAIGEHPHGINRFARAPGTDQDPHATQRAPVALDDLLDQRGDLFWLG